MENNRGGGAWEGAQGEGEKLKRLTAQNRRVTKRAEPMKADSGVAELSEEEEG